MNYCNRDYQIAHRPQQKKACKKRAAELHDVKLFKQSPPAEDCLICMIPLPLSVLDTGHENQDCILVMFIGWVEVSNGMKRKPNIL